MRNAFAASARLQLSYGDAAVIEAARLQGRGQVLSEDLSAGQDYGGVRVTNPFAWHARPRLMRTALSYQSMSGNKR
jgi:predicted nucleic acid-binding protein